MPSPLWFPSTPLLEYVTASYGTISAGEVGGRIGVNSSAVEKWRKTGSGLLAKTADTAAISLGVHPLEIWGDLWLDDRYHPMTKEAKRKLHSRRERDRKRIRAAESRQK